jgi:hypothetical protein
VLRVAGRLLLIGLVLVVGLLLTAGAVGILRFLLAGLSKLLLPGGIGPGDDTLGLFSVNKSS